MSFVERKRWLLFGLPFTFTKYTVTEELITIDTGILVSKEDECYMYKIQDVRLEVSLAEKLAGLGTVFCYAGDVTNPELKLEHIKNAKEIKNFILKYSEEERLKRRTLNTQNIGVHGVVEHDGHLDDLGDFHHNLD